MHRDDHPRTVPDAASPAAQLAGDEAQGDATATAEGTATTEGTSEGEGVTMTDRETGGRDTAREFRRGTPDPASFPIRRCSGPTWSEPTSPIDDSGRYRST